MCILPFCLYLNGPASAYHNHLNSDAFTTLGCLYATSALELRKSFVRSALLSRSRVWLACIGACVLLWGRGEGGVVCTMVCSVHSFKNLGSGRGEASSSTRSRSVFNWRPSGKSTGCFRLFLRFAVCVNTDRDAYRAPCVCPGHVCSFWRFRGGACGRYSRGIRRPPSPPPLPSPFSCLAVLLSHQVSFVVFERLYELLVDFKTAVRFRTYHFVVSVSVRDALRPQSPTLPVVPFFPLRPVGCRSG